MKHLLSLIIPIYNISPTILRQCINSACLQTYTDLEVILVDDGSTDGSGRIVDEFATWYPSRIRVIHQNNGGESAARNTGLRAADGDLIAFLDCDDWIESDMYAKLVLVMDEYHVDLAAGSWCKEFIDHSVPAKNIGDVRNGILSREDLLHYTYMRDQYQGFAFMWDKLYRREILTDSSGELLKFDESLTLGGDVVYLAEILLNTHSAVYIDKPFYHYRQRSNSGMHVQNLDKRMDWLRSYQMVISIMNRAGVDDITMCYIKRFLAYHSMNAARIAYQQKDSRLMKCQSIMRTYQAEYEETNQQYPERVRQFRDIMQIMQ